MVERLPYPDEKENPHPREDLDNALRVREWNTPTTRRTTEPVEPGAPSWWHGDEDASQSFLREMGIDPTKAGDST